MTARRVLLTGGTGFVGANLARRLLRDGHEVHLLVRAEHRPWRIEGIRAHVKTHTADVTDPATMNALLGRVRPDWIFHLAAYGAYEAQADLRQQVLTNVLGTATLLEAAQRGGFQSFVHAGSSSEYGYKGHAPDEHAWLDPASGYAATKAAGTLLCRQMATRTGQRVVTLRLYSAYGPYEEPTRLIPALVTEGLNGRLPPLVSPETARDYVYVEDVCDAFVRVAEAGELPSGAVYNVCTGVQTRLRELVDLTRRLLSISEEPAWSTMPARQWDTTTWVGTNHRICRDTGWSPQTDLETGLNRTIEWLRSDPPLRELYERARAQSSARE